jgi:hypothetical protein
MRTVALFTETPKTAQHLRVDWCECWTDNQGRAPWLPRAGRFGRDVFLVFLQHQACIPEAVGDLGDATDVLPLIP